MIKNNLFCFLTNQVRQKIGADGEIKAAMGVFWENMMSTRLHFHRIRDQMDQSGKSEKRKIEVKFSTRFNQFSEIEIIITELGIFGITERNIKK